MYSGCRSEILKLILIINYGLKMSMALVSHGAETVAID